jgi:hypothetical protein
MPETLSAGGTTMLGFAAIALSLGIALVERALRPAPTAAEPSDQPWGQRWPRYQKDARRGPQVKVS